MKQNSKTPMLIRRIILLLIDSLSIFASFYASFMIFYNSMLSMRFMTHALPEAVLLWIVTMGIFIFFKLYRSLWQFASVTELMNIVLATLWSTFAGCLICIVLGLHVPSVLYIVYFLLLTLFVGGSRFGYRFIRLYASRHHLFGRNDGSISNVMVVGAGAAGEKIYKEISNTPILNKRVVCFIDDDPAKQGRTIHNISIYGSRFHIVEAVEKFKVDEIYIALPSVDKKEVADILNICKETKCKLKRLPGMYQFINDEIILNKLKDVEVQDLLGRDPIKVNLNENHVICD